MSSRTWLLLAGTLVSAIGDQFAEIAYALLAAERGETGFLSAVFVAALVPAIALSVVGGIVTDRFLRPWMWPAALLVMAACFTGMALRPSEVVIVTLVAVSNTCGALIGPVGTATARRTVDASGLAELARWRAASQGFASAVGVLLGALTFALAAVSVLFVVDAASFVLIAVVGGLVLRGLPTLEVPREGSSGILSQAAYGFRLLLSPAAFGLVGIVLIGAVVLGTSLGGVVEVFFFRHTLHASPVEYGIAFAAWAAGVALAPLLRWRTDWRVAVPTAAMTMGVALALPVITRSIVVSIVGYAIGGVANGVFNRETGAVIFSVAKPHEQGRAWAAFGLIAYADALLGFLVGGLSGAAHIKAMTLASGIAPAVAGVVGLAALRGNRARARV